MVFDFIKAIISAWDEDKPARLAAGLAYYSMFSFAPIIFVALTVAGIFLDKVLLAEELYERIGRLLGPETAQMIEDLINAASNSTSGGTIIGTIIGFLALLFAASGLFTNLKYSLNTIWQIPPSEYAGLLAFIKARLIAFVIVIGLGILLVLGAFLSIILNWFSGLIPFMSDLGLLNFLPIILLIYITLVIFYRILPDTKVAWRDVWLAAIVVTLIYGLAAWLLGTILGGLSLSSAFEAAGALAVVLMAIYYASQIFLLGAEFSKVYAYKFGSRKGMEIKE